MSINVLKKYGIISIILAVITIIAIMLFVANTSVYATGGASTTSIECGSGSGGVCNPPC